jgi:hypothetical protein
MFKIGKCFLNGFYAHARVLCDSCYGYGGKDMEDNS